MIPLAQVDPSAAKKSPNSPLKMIRRKSTEKNTARRIRRQILLAENPPWK